MSDKTMKTLDLEGLTTAQIKEVELFIESLKKKGKRRKRKIRDESVKMNLTDQDLEFLLYVYKYRLLTVKQAYYFADGNRENIIQPWQYAHRRFNKMWQNGYVRLIDTPNSFRKNHPNIYGLDKKGAIALERKYGIDISNLKWTEKQKGVKSDWFIEHTLMISEIMATIVHGCRSRKDLEFIYESELIENRPIKAEKKFHKRSWRYELKKGYQGLERDRVFGQEPDRAFGIRKFKKDGQIETEKYFFLEADRKTMPVKRVTFNRSSYFRHMVGYIASYRNRLYSQYWGFKNVRVLTVTGSEKRIQSMIDLNAELHPKKQGYGQFLFTHEKAINLDEKDNAFKEIWVDGTGQMESLLD